ncbi:putative iron uptake protein [Sphingobium herbicidovorans NBRC 16415]|jgi:hypothetical protein|uniref:Iron uptake protein n=1 Tax=Sphingobium herbicidovorans (strain ATCC 700291 / DSM 11019 / CCUG 56400 / KCTC 2939 / LMG 18315 / NBRC 16415 / MH) TaxID=1219045 RepID=A0A086P6A0_SPHHM|nr:hypothetical protein [Sphingobium herbicidovorans]KFG88918.1 putative iron uptake protein [Sphingobium herbicidovorans NBRC 16415]
MTRRNASATAWRAVLPRVLAASVGAYAVCYAWIGALVLILPMDRVDANILATNAAFLLFVGIILRSFAIRGVRRLWLEIAGGTALPTIIILGAMR